MYWVSRDLAGAGRGEAAFFGATARGGALMLLALHSYCAGAPGRPAPAAGLAPARPWPPAATSAADAFPKPTRVVFSLTTTAARIDSIKPVLDAIVEQQSRPVDRAYLALPPNVTLPKWLQEYNSTSKRPGVLRCLPMARDYGPASKLLAALREGGERDPSTVIIWGDDDVYYGSELVQLHLEAQERATVATAFAPRLVTLDSAPAGCVGEACAGQQQNGDDVNLHESPDGGMRPAENETACMCDYPGTGTAGHNSFTCMTGGHVNESRSCGENEECHSRHPIRFGEWGGLCRVPIGPNAPELLIEGTGTVSVRASVASALPKAAFAVSDEPDACRLSDDYWLSHFLRAAEVSLEGLPKCRFDYEEERYDDACGVPFYEMPQISSIDALSTRGAVKSANSTVAKDAGNFEDQVGSGVEPQGAAQAAACYGAH